MNAPKYNPEIARLIRECIGQQLYVHQQNGPEHIELESTVSHKIIFTGSAKEAYQFVRARAQGENHGR